MPPCEEGVEWLVLDEPIEVSPRQIAAVAAACPFNARPIQPSHGRDVHLFEHAPVRSEAV
jgi:carbonic anhydrase